MSSQIIPPRWLNCPRQANDLVAEIFMPIKTPLSNKFEIPIGKSFTPSTVISLMKTRTPKLGLLIDLTNTSRYYDKNEFESQGIIYYKFHRNDYQRPNVEQTFDFIEECLKFRAEHPDEGIVVHCTHGFNRTGFLIVSFLVEAFSWTLEDAITEFARARPPGIYQEDYLQELSFRYKQPTSHFLPYRPIWSRSEKSENVVKISKELPKGIKEVTSEKKLKKIRGLIYDLCGSHFYGFPGVKLTSLQDTEFVRNEPYRVSWKANGTRYMMFIERKGKVYLLDTENRVFRVENLAFLKRKCWGKHLVNTLMDGELVVEKIGDQIFLNYLIFDLVRLEYQNIGPDFDRRRRFIKKEIIEQLVHLNGELHEPFGVELKEFWDIRDTRMLVSEEFKKQLTHSCDGLVFQPARSPSLNSRSLKWKPLELNSIDFRLVISTKRNEGLLYVEHSKIPFGEIEITHELTGLNGKVIECSYANGKWRFVRERKDKSVPNSFTVANTIWKTIENPITEEQLLSGIDKFRWKEVRKEAPSASPPAKRRKRN